MSTRSPASIKRATPYTSSTTPACAVRGETLSMCWIDPPLGVLRAASTTDLLTYTDPIDLAPAADGAIALAADPSGLLAAWVEPATQEVCCASTADGVTWDAPARSALQATGGVRLAWHDGRWWLLRRTARGRGGIALASSADGHAWQDAEAPELSGDGLPGLLVLDDRLTLVWVDRAGRLLSVVVGVAQRPHVLHEGPVGDHALLADAAGLHLALADHPTGRIVVHDGTRAGWQERMCLHERVMGAPALASRHGELVVGWVRDDGVRGVCLAVPSGPAIFEDRFVFHGDVVGHPTALDPAHRTPFPYLGVVVLPTGWDLPKGTTEASLLAALQATFTQATAFWGEASYGAVDISVDVHPAVVPLPLPMDDYLLRCRAKLIDGFGTTFPVKFAGGETLTVTGAGGFTVTVTFSAGTFTRDEIKNQINAAVDAAGYTGPAAAKPHADASDVGQLRIRTSEPVSPGTALDVTGGTAMALLGLDPANRLVFEGSTMEIPHHELLLRDTLRGVLAGRPDPMGYLTNYYGVVVCVASNLGWSTLHAVAERPREHAVLDGEKPYLGSAYWITSVYPPEVHVHELGHTLGLLDLYESGSRNVGVELDTWDVMDSGVLAHPCAWTKSYGSAPAEPGSRWMPGDHVAVLDALTGSIEVLLAPVEAKFPAGNPFAVSHPGVPLVHAVKIPLDANHAFFVENRQRGPFNDATFGTVTCSAHLPGSGVIVTDAVNDVGLTNLDRAQVVLVHPMDLNVGQVPDDVIVRIAVAATLAEKQALITPFVPGVIPQWLAGKIVKMATLSEIAGELRGYRDGEIRAFYPMDTKGEEIVVYQLPDGSGDIRVRLIDVIGAAPQVPWVRVSKGRRGSWFDLEIRPWQNPPPYESPDIWIDSEENGWDAYQHSDATANPGVPGNPVLNGDRPWVGHGNLVHARVWNRGDIARHHVRVDFAEVVPPGTNSGYPFASTYVDLPADGSAIASVLWNPRSLPPDEHGCISATVAYQAADPVTGEPAELNANNNCAQENITDFYLPKGSPYEPIELPFEFTSPLPEPSEMMLQPRGLQPGWRMTVEPSRFALEPGDRIQGMLRLEADESVPLEDAAEGHPAPVVSLEALVRIGCTWQPVAGISMTAHTVRQASMEVSAARRGAAAHVTVQASDDVGPVWGANVAACLVLRPGQAAAPAVRSVTDGDGRAVLLVPVDWAALAGAPAQIDVRLSPHRHTGPTEATVTAA